MYARSYDHGTEVVFYQQKVDELCFVTAGCVSLFTSDGLKFMALPEKAVFGDYAILHDLRSNISWRTTGASEDVDGEGGEEKANTALMCVRKEVLLNLCNLYPQTEQVLKVLSLEKRKLYMHYLGETLSLSAGPAQSGVPRTIDSREGASKRRTAAGPQAGRTQSGEDALTFTAA